MLSAQTACSYVISGPAAGTSVDVGGTSVGLGDDAITGALPIGFNFNFFGVSYSQFVISSNGFISFDLAAGTGCCSGQVLPNNTTPNNLVAGFWEDLAPNVGGSIGYGVFGTAPARRLVISYTSVPHYSTGIPVTFQIKLHESSNVVEVVCIDCTTDGGLHTQGIDNLGGSVAFVPSGRNSASFSSVNETTTFTPVDATIPSITCPSNISVACAQTVTFSAASGADNCAFARVTQVAGLASGATFPTGTNTVTFRARDHGASGTFFNGAGGTFSYNEGDSPQTIALKACESVYGTGNCVVGACGSFSYYYRSGHPNCNCSKAAGQYEFVYANSGYTDVGQDYGGTNAPVTYVPFVRVKGPNGCSVPNTWLVSNDRLGGNFNDCSFTVNVGTGVTPANAGPDQTVCGTAVTLAANTPTVGTGAWSILAGAGGTVTTPASPTSGFTGVAGTTYTLRWTIAQAPCASSTDDVIITLRANPTAAGAGPDQSICGNSGTLAGNTPTVGTGTWTIIAGAGGGIVAPTSPNSTVFGATGTTYTLRWTIANAPCTSTTDDVLITFVGTPTTANAGPDQTLCGSSATLAGNSPTAGIGSWSIVSGAGGTVTTPGSPTSTFTGVAGTIYTLRWTISNAPCTASTDDVIITLRANPTTSNAGPDQSLCGTSTNLAGNTPTSGTGSWSIVSGAGGSVGTPTNPTSSFTGVAGTTYTLRWTIANAPCTASTDDVLVTFVASPTTANAGTDQTVCGTAATLAANTPTTGTGSWSIVSGAGGTVTTPASPTSGFTGIVGTTYTLRWTISNAPCVASTDDVLITLVGSPTVAAAGPDETVCGTSAILAGNAPTTGTGSWSIIAGAGGTVTTPTSPTSTFTGVSGTTYTLRWTITNAPCVASSDDVLITISNPSTVANAGPDEVFCGLSTTLAGNAPIVGTGTWSIISGTGGSIATPTSPTSSFTGVAGQVYILRWTITNPPCAPTTDDVQVAPDNIAPSITCPANSSDPSLSGQCNLTVAYTAPVGTDNCPSAVTVQSAGLASGSSFPVGTTVNTFTVTDALGNTSSCSFSVTVTDVQAPAAICQNVTVLLDNAGNGATTAGAVNNGSSDNCAIASYSLSQLNFVCGEVGANTEVLTVTDVNGNTGTCNATVTVQDNIAPVAVCTNVTLTLDVSGNATATPSAVGAGSTDACGTPTFALSQSSFTCADLGANTEVLTATDASGNSSTCTATITVVDNLAPSAVCQNVTVQLDNTGNGSTTAAAVNNGSSDACGIQSLALSQTAFVCSEVGANTEVLTVTDVNGNSTTCSTTITVEDNVAPAAICQNLTVQLDGTGNASITAAQVNNGSTDACGVQSLALNNATFNCGNLGGTTVILTVTDVNGNSSTCTPTITVQDNISPVAVCQNLTVQLDNSGNGSTTAAAVNNGSSDNCAIASFVLSQSAFVCSEVGANTEVLTATDASGNSSTCTATITVVDNLAPSAVCQNVSVWVDAGGNASVTAAAVGSGSTDPCGVSSLVLTPNAFTCSNIGANSAVLTATDGSGNSSTCAATISVIDSIFPVIGCPGNQSLVAGPGCSEVATWLAPSGTDNCGVPTTVGSDTSGTTFPAGVTTVTYTTTDASNNSSTCSFTITVTAAPLVVGATSPLLGCGFDLACASDTNAVVTSTVTGGCTPYTYLWSTGGTGASEGNLGAGTVTVTVTDGAGATSTATYTVTAPTPIVAVITGDSVLCAGINTGSLVATVSGGQTCQAYDYLWSTGDTTNTLVNLSAGTYSVTVTDAAGCTTIATQVIQAGAVATLNLGPNVSSCPGVSATLSAPNTFNSYLWSNGDTTNSISVTTPGDYSLTVTSVDGCAASDTITLSAFVVDNNTITANGSLSLCDGDTVELVGDPGLTNYLWSTGATTTSILVSGTGGSITLSTTDLNGCVVVDTIVVNYQPWTDPLPVITPGPTVVICAGGSEVLSAGTYQSYLWSTGATTATISVTTAGNYQVTVTNAAGCSKVSAAVAVTVAPNPTPVLVLNSGTLSTTQTYSTYQWLLNGNQIPGAINATYTPALAGTYSVTVTDSNGCTGTSNTEFVDPVAVGEVFNELNGLQLYPNPSMGTVNLRTMSPIDWPMTVEIWDMFGKKVNAFEMAHLMDVASFDLSNIAAGTYLMKITSFRRNTTQQTVMRFVVE